MVVNVRMGAAQPNGLGVGNEVDFVTALRQLQPQLGCDHATAAVGRIAGDADFHVRPFRCTLRLFRFDGGRRAGIHILPHIHSGEPYRGKSKEEVGCYPAPWLFFEGSAAAAMSSTCCCSRFWVCSSRPVNSMPMPTPPSQVLTIAVVLIFSESSQIEILKVFPTGRGSMVSI